MASATYRAVRRLGFAAVLCGCLSAWTADVAAQSTSKPATSTSKPAASVGRLVRMDDAWLSKAAMEQLEQAAKDGTYKELGATVQAAMLDRLCCGISDKLDTLNDLVYVARACEYLPLADSLPEGPKMSAWLVKNRPVSRLLFRAMADVKKPADSLKQFQELFTADEKAVLEYPNLAVAFATTHATTTYNKQPDPATLVESFNWYAKGKIRFRYDLKAMPYEISRFLAATRLSLAERQWAATTYGTALNPAKGYFDLAYDYDYYLKGVDKKISKLDFTLPNLRKVGGVCIEQAYYATEICRALGIPAMIVTGTGGSGIGHAWVACLQINGASATWDTKTGRYETQLYFTGELPDPAAGKAIKDSELALCGAAALYPLERREQAETALYLARLAQKARAAEAEPDMSAIRKLAEQFIAAHPGERDKCDTGSLRMLKAPDLDLVENLLIASTELNLADKTTWDFIVELRKSDQLPVDHLDKFFETLVTKTVKEFPDYSCQMVLKIIPTIPKPDHRDKIYDRVIKIYGFRPDLQGQILMAAGDDYVKQDKKEKAYGMYELAATRCVALASIVVDAARKAEKILVDADKRPAAIELYAKLFAMTSKSDAAQQFSSETSFYQLGSRLATLLSDAGQKDAAQKVRTAIGAKTN